MDQGTLTAGPGHHEMLAKLRRRVKCRDVEGCRRMLIQIRWHFMLLRRLLGVYISLEEEARRRTDQVEEPCAAAASI